MGASERQLCAIGRPSRIREQEFGSSTPKPRSRSMRGREKSANAPSKSATSGVKNGRADQGACGDGSLSGSHAQDWLPIQGDARTRLCAANALSRLNKDRVEKLNVRMALHLGEVVYGNIGAIDRLASRLQTARRPSNRIVFRRSDNRRPLKSSNHLATMGGKNGRK
jgi:class 3 adenylate cyclase